MDLSEPACDADRWVGATVKTSSARAATGVAGFDEITGGGLPVIDLQIPKPVFHDRAFDLLGLLAVVDAKVRSVGAKRVVFDGIDVLLDVLDDPALIRRELFRLRHWRLESKLTAMERKLREADVARIAEETEASQRHDMSGQQELEFLRRIGAAPSKPRVRKKSPTVRS